MQKSLERARILMRTKVSMHVETVVLLSKLGSAKHHIEVELKMSDLDLTSAESKATYAEIVDYVYEQTGLKVSHLYIAQVKEKCGLEKRKNHRLPESEGAKGPVDLCPARTEVETKIARQPQCPKEKEEAIIEALKHFRMI